MVVMNVFILLLMMGTLSCAANRPNIVFIIADDMGWNDVSFHGSDQTLTPNIDLLAYSGVALGRYYSHAVCTPSRSALLTGKYSYKLGMQGYPLVLSEDRGLPTSITILPEYLKEAGYSTHIVGKWHVGSSREEYLPTKRGFDSHFGHRGGYLDYYEYSYEEDWGKLGRVAGLALFRNQTPAWDVEGYITDIYTEQATSIINKHDTSSPLFLMVAHNAPHASNDGALLQAPHDTVREMRYVESPQRRIFAAMIKKLDDSVGDIVAALYAKGILDNTIIAFVSDNGGMTSGEFNNFASNYPLRGIKMSPFEGGLRVVGLLWSANLNNTSHYWDGYMHVIDWLPTLLSAAGIETPADIDGINQWDSINSNSPSERITMYEIDDMVGYASIIYGDYKLLTGEVIQNYCTYQGSNLTGLIGKPPCYVDAIVDSTMYRVLDLIGQPFNIHDLSLRKNTIVQCDTPPTDICFPGVGKVCLYNIREDPCETTELSASYPHLVLSMQALLQAEVSKRIPRKKVTYRNPLSAPSRFNYTWDTWVQ
ncbi:arylsulfatase B-like [Helicoverpa zea]|uniref:arylsulfatase B-like n=1 Tax=Helicoverpa zea TaxID=7113 RepID=UPI001F568CFB|nr:arylsulfatase B-like [Helicoverpa zea]